MTPPIALELFRRFPSRDLSMADASAGDSSWRIDVTTAPTDGPNGLVSVLPGSSQP